MMSIRRRISKILLAILVILLASSYMHVCHGLTQQSNKKIRVQVCQNKDCCQRYQGKAQNLVETIQHLAPSMEVESSGCLSHCGKGPNILIQKGNGQELYYGDVVDAASAGAVLEMATDIPVHATLLAAANVMERASKATSLEEKKRFLTSVISALEKKDELKESFAMAHAHAMRAKVNVKMHQLQEAVSDAECAVTLDPAYDKAWRTLADAQEAAGDTPGAIETLRRWSKARPLFSTKANKEIQRLRERS